jgi:hypothetical protein
MTLTETHVVNHLTNKGAATKFELSQELGYTKATTQKAVSKLLSSGRVEATPVRRKHNSPRGHVVYRIVAAPVTAQPAPESTSLNIFEHAGLYNRLSVLESQFKHLNTNYDKLQKNFDELSKDEVATYERLNKAVKLVNKLELNRIRIEDAINADRSRMDGFAARLLALEPQPEVDPLYVEIERDITAKLGGQVSPELLFTIINEAYAERSK